MKIAPTTLGRVKTIYAIADAYQRIIDYEKAQEIYNESVNLLMDYSEDEKFDIRLGIVWIYYLKEARNFLEQILINVKDPSNTQTTKKEELIDPESKLTCIIGKAKAKSKESLVNKKFMITHLYAALELLKNALEYTKV